MEMWQSSTLKRCDSNEPRNLKFIKGYDLLLFYYKMGKTIGKNLSSKDSQKHFDHAKQFATEAKLPK